MVSGFERRMLSGMLGLLSVDCAKAEEVAPAMGMAAPATTCLSENRCGLRSKRCQPCYRSCNQFSQYSRAAAEGYALRAGRQSESRACLRTLVCYICAW